MPDRAGDPPTAAPTAILSPCVRNCCLDEEDICLGCFRSVQEICAWSACSDTEKRRILDDAARRKQQRSGM